MDERKNQRKHWNKYWQINIYFFQSCSDAFVVILPLRLTKKKRIKRLSKMTSYAYIEYCDLNWIRLWGPWAIKNVIGNKANLCLTGTFTVTDYLQMPRPPGNFCQLLPICRLAVSSWVCLLDWVWILLTIA